MGFQEDVEKLNIKSVIVGSVISALGFLVALSWRDTIKAAIETLVPKREGLAYMFASSVIITVIAVLAGYILLKVAQNSVSPRRLVRSRISAFRSRKVGAKR